jgi:hypothetical protein
MKRSLAFIGGLTALVALMAAPTAAQAPKTPWGDPDLQGIWRNMKSAPLERPAELQGREFLTQEEMDAKIKKAQAHRANRESGKVDQRGFRAQPNYNDIFGVDKGVTSDGRHLASRRTSAISDPPDGRLPLWTDQQVKYWQSREAATAGRGEADSYEDRSLGERCIVTFNVAYVGRWGLGQSGAENAEVAAAKADPTVDFVSGGEGGGGPMVGRIIQAPGYVAMIHEEGNEGEALWRVFDLNRKSPRLKSDHKQWRGDSVARFEGDTLVIETTNITYGGPIFTNYGQSVYPGTGETLKVTERYRRLDADNMDYRVTIEDPAVYVRPYTAVYELTRDDGYKPLPTLCHENNRDMGAILANARTDEFAAMEFADEARRERAERFKNKMADLNARKGSR